MLGILRCIQWLNDVTNVVLIPKATSSWKFCWWLRTSTCFCLWLKAGNMHCIHFSLKHPWFKTIRCSLLILFRFDLLAMMLVCSTLWRYAVLMLWALVIGVWWGSNQILLGGPSKARSFPGLKEPAPAHGCRHLYVPLKSMCALLLKLSLLLSHTRSLAHTRYQTVCITSKPRLPPLSSPVLPVSAALSEL